MSYKGVKARGSWNYEAFNKGRIQCAKLNIKGKTLTLCINLDPEEYNVNKYHFNDMSENAKYAKTPMLLKVRSDRALKYALELIDEMMKKLQIPESKLQSVDYHMPYENTDELVKKGLVKVILPAGIIIDENTNVVRVDVGALINSAKANGEKAPADEAPADEAPADEAPAEEAPAEEAPAEEALSEQFIHVDAAKADQLVTDEEAAASITVVHTSVSAGNKMGQVNLDTICDYFEDGETVDLAALKAKHLVPKNVGKIKVLARGTMTKAITVVADKFSLQAVKMITLAGGHAQVIG